MTLSLVKNLDSFANSSSELMKYKVRSEQITDLIVKIGIPKFIDRYSGSYLYGYDSGIINTLYSKDNKKLYKVDSDIKDNQGNVVISKGDHKFGSEEFTKIIKKMPGAGGDYKRYVNKYIITKPESADIIKPLIVDSDGSTPHIEAKYFENAKPIIAYIDGRSSQFSMMYVNDMEDIFRASGASTNQLYTELLAKILQKVDNMLSTVGSIVSVRPFSSNSKKINLIDTTTLYDEKKFANLFNNINDLIAFISKKLPAYDETLDKADMDRIIAAIRSPDAHYRSLRNAIMDGSAQDGKYSRELGYNNLYGLYNFLITLKGQSVSTAATSRAISTGDVEYIKLKTTDINFPAGHSSFNIKGNQLVAFFNNNLDRFPRNKDHLIKLTFNITSSSYSGPKVQIITGGTGKLVVDLASSRMLQKAIEKIEMIAPVARSTTSVLEIEVPRMASLRENFYSEFANILKKTVKNS